MDLDHLVMSTATRLRVEGHVDDADQLESCMATLRETPRSVDRYALVDALESIQGAAQVAAEIIAKHTEFGRAETDLRDSDRH